MQKPKQQSNIPLFSIIIESSNYIIYQNNETKKMFQLFKFTKQPNPKNNCREICEHNLKYPHMGCLFDQCRIGKAYRGEFPIEVPVDMRFIFLNENRRFKKLKNKILKEIWSIAEWFM